MSDPRAPLGLAPKSALSRHRARVLVALGATSALGIAVAVAGGCSTSSSHDTFDPGQPEASDEPPVVDNDAACGLRCQQKNCSDGKTTSVSGVVLDPAGKNPIYNAIVYVPAADVKAFEPGVHCDTCGTVATGAPLVSTLTDVHGHFKLDNMPVGANIPLVIQIGRWRRRITLPSVPECVETPLTDPNLTRLPKNKNEGDIPQIAITTGCDPMECLLRSFGIDDSEFTAPTQFGRVHLYKSANGAGALGSPFAQTLWEDPAALAKYDMILMSCECGTNPETKSTQARQNLHDYISAGGRVFAAHYHYIWFEEGPLDFVGTAAWTPNANASNTTVFNIDTSFPKGQALSDWLGGIDASAGPGQIHMSYVANDVGEVTAGTSQRWIYEVSDAGPDAKTDAGVPLYGSRAKYYSFNAPVGKPPAEQCGRVVYTDIHFGIEKSNPATNLFPDNCDPSRTNDEAKALEFLLFDLASCVQRDVDPPTPPK